MASQSSIPAASCAVCGKDAKYRCARCTEGLGSYAQEECKVKNARKQRYRAGEVLRQCFRVHSDLLQKDMQMLSDKPEDNIQWACDVSIPIVMHGLVKAALKGATTGCTEVRVQLEGLPTFGLFSFAEAKHNLFSNTGPVYRIRLSDSSSYVLDLGDAGNTREHAVMPWTELMDKHVVSIIDSNELGHCKRGFGNMVRPSEAATTAIDGMDTLGHLLAARSEEYLLGKTMFVERFEKTLTELKEKANEAGQFDMHMAAMRAAFSKGYWEVQKEWAILTTNTTCISTCTVICHNCWFDTWTKAGVEDQKFNWAARTKQSWESDDWHRVRWRLIPLLFTCKMVYDEAIGQLYSCNIFSMRRIDTVLRLPMVMLPNRFQQIRRINFSTALKDSVRVAKASEADRAGMERLVATSRYHRYPEPEIMWITMCEILACLKNLQDLQIDIAFYSSEPGHLGEFAETVHVNTLLGVLDPLKLAKAKRYEVKITSVVSDELRRQLGPTPFELREHEIEGSRERCLNCETLITSLGSGNV
nr:hypothetical protein B0A51_07355 [Rachicladosporium sp. CCFEE 5018]